MRSNAVQQDSVGGLLLDLTNLPFGAQLQYRHEEKGRPQSKCCAGLQAELDADGVSLPPRHVFMENKGSGGSTLMELLQQRGAVASKTVESDDRVGTEDRRRKSSSQSLAEAMKQPGQSLKQKPVPVAGGTSSACRSAGLTPLEDAGLVAAEDLSRGATPKGVARTMSSSGGVGSSSLLLNTTVAIGASQRGGSFRRDHTPSRYADDEFEDDDEGNNGQGHGAETTVTSGGGACETEKGNTDGRGEDVRWLALENTDMFVEEEKGNNILVKTTGDDEEPLAVDPLANTAAELIDNNSLGVNPLNFNDNAAVDPTRESGGSMGEKNESMRFQDILSPETPLIGGVTTGQHQGTAIDPEMGLHEVPQAVLVDFIQQRIRAEVAKTEALANMGANLGWSLQDGKASQQQPMVGRNQRGFGIPVPAAVATELKKQSSSSPGPTSSAAAGTTCNGDCDATKAAMAKELYGMKAALASLESALPEAMAAMQHQHQAQFMQMQAAAAASGGLPQPHHGHTQFSSSSNVLGSGSPMTPSLSGPYNSQDSPSHHSHHHGGGRHRASSRHGERHYRSNSFTRRDSHRHGGGGGGGGVIDVHVVRAYEDAPVAYPKPQRTVVVQREKNRDVESSPDQHHHHSHVDPHHHQHASHNGSGLRNSFTNASHSHHYHSQAPTSLQPKQLERRGSTGNHGQFTGNRNTNTTAKAGAVTGGAGAGDVHNSRDTIGTNISAIGGGGGGGGYTPMSKTDRSNNSLNYSSDFVSESVATESSMTYTALKAAAGLEPHGDYSGASFTSTPGAGFRASSVSSTTGGGGYTFGTQAAAAGAGGPRGSVNLPSAYNSHETLPLGMPSRESSPAPNVQASTETPKYKTKLKRKSAGSKSNSTSTKSTAGTAGRGVGAGGGKLHSTASSMEEQLPTL